MRKPITATIAALAFAPAAQAHHSEPYCRWGDRVLPRAEAVRVTLERDHFMQEGCDGTTVRVTLGGAAELTLRVPEGGTRSRCSARVSRPCAQVRRRAGRVS